MKKLSYWISKNFKVQASYDGDLKSTSTLRKKLSLSCFVYIGIYLIFFIALPEYLNYLFNWHLMLTSVAIHLGFILVQLILPMLLPWGKWLTSGVALYAVISAVMWGLYGLNEQADEHGLTGGVLSFCNILFFGIVLLRCLSKIIFRYFAKNTVEP